MGIHDGFEGKDLLIDSEGISLIGERIMLATRNVADLFALEIDVRRIGIDKKYTDKLKSRLIEPSLLKYVQQERMVVQGFFEVDPALLPSLLDDEPVYGVVVLDENRDGMFTFSQTLLLKDFHQDNPYMNWYYDPVKAKKGVWSDIYFDPYLNMDIVTYSQPVYIDKTLVGVVGMDLDYADFHQTMNNWLIENFQSKIAMIERQHRALGQQDLTVGRYLNLDTLQVIGVDESADGIVTQSSQMQKVLKMAVKAAVSNANILILGETGVGKDFIADFIHRNSQQQKGPFINVNCSAIPESLLESEFFGYVKGAFTGAKNEGKPGYFELADKGTIFLNEVGEIPMHLQVKFLNVIQQRAVIRLGATQQKTIDARIIAATNRNLYDLVQHGTFREDLYYRLNVISIVIPPLRERRDDVLSLLICNLHRNCERYGVVRYFTPELTERLLKYDWPGNIRELENMVERLVVASDEEVIDEALLQDVFADRQETLTPCHDGKLKDMLENFEAHIFQEAYDAYHSSYKVAQALGISQSQASKKIRMYVHLQDISD